MKGLHLSAMAQGATPWVAINGVCAKLHFCARHYGKGTPLHHIPMGGGSKSKANRLTDNQYILLTLTFNGSAKPHPNPSFNVDWLFKQLIFFSLYLLYLGVYL